MSSFPEKLWITLIPFLFLSASSHTIPMLNKKITIAFSLLAFGFIGCAHSPQSKTPAQPVTQSKIVNPIKATRPTVLPLKGENPAREIASRDVRWIAQAKREKKKELQTKALDRVNEEQAFAKVKAAFDSNSPELVTLSTAFVKKFPKSSFVDDVTYLVGLSAWQGKDYGKALKSWNLVISQFPNSQKRVSALLAKAILLKKIEMAPEAKKTFLDLVKQYPESPEAERAQIELRLMQ